MTCDVDGFTNISHVFKCTTASHLPSTGKMQVGLVGVLQHRAPSDKDTLFEPKTCKLIMETSGVGFRVIHPATRERT